MPKPPFWLQWLGPPLAGLAAGLGARAIDGFWPLVILAVLVGFAPIIAHRLWRRAWMARGGGTPPKPAADDPQP